MQRSEQGSSEWVDRGNYLAAVCALEAERWPNESMRLQCIAALLAADEEAAERRHDPERSLAIREAAMARNIDVELLQRDPRARLLIWVGGDDAAKRPLFGDEWMALRLWQRTGIEPFSVYQLSDSGDAACDEPLYALLVKHAGHRFDEPVAVVLPGDGFGPPIPEAVRRHPVYSRMIEHGMDAVVLHPPGPFETEFERPAWQRRWGTAMIHGSVSRGGAPCPGYLVQAIRSDEGAGSTPAARVGDERVVATLEESRIDAGQRAKWTVRLPD